MILGTTEMYHLKRCRSIINKTAISANLRNLTFISCWLEFVLKAPEFKLIKDTKVRLFQKKKYDDASFS